MSRVVHFQRRPPIGAFSIEGLFNAIRSALVEHGCNVDTAVAPYESIGVINRMRNLVWARTKAGAVNHVTGDINYVSLAFPKHTVILTIHDLNTLDRLKGMRRWLYRLLWFALPIRFARVVTAISQTTKERICHEFKLPPESVRVIPDAVPQVFRPSSKSFCVGCPRILQVGAKPNKNLVRLIAALEEINCHLHLVGHPDKRTLEILLKSGLSHTIDADLSPDELYQVYCEADLVTLVSTCEGFGMPIIEAQWVERPVVTSNCSSMPEVAGQGACLVNPFDVASIRRGIQQVICDPDYREELIAHGRENRQRFRVSAIARQYLQLYVEVLS